MKILNIIFLLVIAASASAETYKEAQEEIEQAYLNQNYEKMTQLVQDFAEKGDVTAMFHLCTINWFGYGEQKDITNLNWCKKENEEYGKSQETLEIAAKVKSAMGGKTFSSYAGAVKLIEIEAEKNVELTWLMYLIHNNGLYSFFSRDRNKEKKWFELAVQAEHPEALVEKAVKKYLFVSNNEEASIKENLLKKASEKGIARADFLLGLHYKPDEYRESENTPYQSYEKATDSFRKAANKGYEDAVEYLYKILRNPKNPNRDYDEGLMNIIKAAEMGYVAAQVELAEIYEKGRELPKSYQLATKYYSLAANQPVYNFSFMFFTKAKYKLGYFKKHGLGTDINVEESVGHFQNVAKREFEHKIDSEYESDEFVILSKYNLGKVYLEEKESYKKAISWFSAAANQRGTRANYWNSYLEIKTSNPSVELIKSIQSALSQLGYKTGGIDGQFGKLTYDSIRAYQCERESTIDGSPSSSLLDSLQKYTRSKSIPESTLNKMLADTLSNLNYDCAYALLAQGASPNYFERGRGQFDRLSYGFNRDYFQDAQPEIELDLAKLLVRYGGKISIRNSGIFSAISSDDAEVTKFMLENGLKATSIMDGKSLIHWAAYYDSQKVEKLLIEYGAKQLSTSDKARERVTNFGLIFNSSSSIPVVEKAIKDGAYLNLPNSAGMYPLVSVLRSSINEMSQVRLIEYMLKQGADPNISGESRLSGVDGIPLHVFIVMNSRMHEDPEYPSLKNRRKFGVKVLQLLLENGAKISSKDSRGRTPLHVAAESNNIIAAQVLIDLGALPGIRDKKGKVPLELAETAEMIALLKGELIVGNKKNDKEEKSNTSGSGFFISQEGHIVTNEHVVSECSAITISTDQGVINNAKKIFSDPSNDLAILKLEGQTLSKTTYAKLRISDVKLGESIIVAGYPYGEMISTSIKVTSGVVSSTKGLGNNTSQFQLDAAIQPGNSGGPLFDASGNIIGVVVAQIDKIKMAEMVGSLPENSNFGIKSSTVRSFLESNGLEVDSVKRGESLSIEQVASIAEKQTVMVNCE